MQLKKSHLANVGATERNVTALLPVSRVQPFVVADSKNTLHCFELQPLRSVVKWAVEAKAVQRVELAKLQQNEAPLEQLFAASGSKLLGFNPDGTEFKSQDLYVAQPLKHFRVEGMGVWAATDFFLSHFIGTKEIEHFAMQDRINDMLICRVSGDAIPNPVLACQDRVLRVLDGENEKYGVGVSGPATCLSSYNKHAGDFTHSRRLLYGTSNGTLGLVELGRERPMLLWSLNTHTESVIAIKQIDLTGNGLNDVVISREGGTVQVYSAENEQFELKAEISLGESVNSLVTGTPRAVPEVVATTHSGKIIGLTNETRAQAASAREDQEIELAVMQRKLEEEKSRFQASRSNPPSSARSAAAVSSYTATFRKRLVTGDYMHILTVESQIPIGELYLTSQIPLTLVDTDSLKGNLNNLSKDRNFEALITYQEPSVTMQEIKFRVPEGCGGAILIYVLPKTASKIAQMLTYELPTLSLYEKTANRPSGDYCSELMITGSFTITEVTRWLRKVFADIPDSVPTTEVALCFISETGATLNINYKAGQFVAKSESVSSLENIKETFSKEAGPQKGLSFNLNVNQDSVDFMLHKIDRRYKDVLSSTLNVHLVEAISEMANTGELANLSDENREIYERREELLQNKEVSQGILVYLQGIIRDLYFDWRKVSGAPASKQELTVLERLLTSYNLDNLITYFHS